MNRQRVAVLILLACFGGVLASAPSTGAQEWRPFDDRFPPWGARPQVERPQRERPWVPPPEPQRGYPQAPLPREPEPVGPSPRGHQQIAPLLAPVERSELPPVMANDGSGMPLGTWDGLDLETAERLMAKLDLPPRSPALMGLWRRLITASGDPSGASPAQFTAVRAEALYRSGQLEELGQLLSGGSASSDPVLAALSARFDLAMDRRDSGCSAVRASAARKQELPKQLRGEILVLAGYCAAAAGDPSGASLAAELAREEGLNDAGMIGALEAIAAKRPARLPRTGNITPTHYRLLKLAKAADVHAVLDRASAALISTLLLDPTTDDQLRVAAAEAGARINAVSPEALAGAYRATRFSPRQLAEPLASAEADPMLSRALLFQAAEAERHPARRAQALRAFLDDARRAGFYFHALAAAAPLADSIPKSPDFAWFSESAIEAALAGGSPANVRGWAAADGGMRSRSSLEHWLALADVADPDMRGGRGRHLAALEDLAMRGQFSAPVLHRLATVLDALDYQVPMNLWQAASSTPQPNDGYLPETGVLPDLHEASTRKEFARTVLLAMHAIGPKGPEETHIIALGDVIRALKRIGLEADARRIGFEALFGAWPRAAIH